MYLKDKYEKEVLPALVKEFALPNVMRAPKVVKVILNMGLGEAVNDKKILDFAVSDMSSIAGQKAVVTKAKKSISGFKIREGYPIGCKVTLRKKNMWNFLDKLVHISMPRIRDFRGLSSKSFDNFGNYSFGIKEQIIFPEIDFGRIDKIRGMNITLVTTASNNEEGVFLLKKLGFPLV